MIEYLFYFAVLVMPAIVVTLLVRDVRKNRKKRNNPKPQDNGVSPFERGEEIPQVSKRIAEVCPWTQGEKKWVWVKGGPPKVPREKREEMIQN